MYVTCDYSEWNCIWCSFIRVGYTATIHLAPSSGIIVYISLVSQLLLFLFRSVTNVSSSNQVTAKKRREQERRRVKQAALSSSTCSFSSSSSKSFTVCDKISLTWTFSSCEGRRKEVRHEPPSNWLSHNHRHHQQWQHRNKRNRRRIGVSVSPTFFLKLCSLRSPVAAAAAAASAVAASSLILRVAGHPSRIASHRTQAIFPLDLLELTTGHIARVLGWIISCHSLTCSSSLLFFLFSRCSSN